MAQDIPTDSLEIPASLQIVSLISKQKEKRQDQWIWKQIPVFVYSKWWKCKEATTELQLFRWNPSFRSSFLEQFCRCQWSLKRSKFWWPAICCIDKIEKEYFCFLLYKCSFTKWCCFEPWRERRNSGRPGGSKKRQHHRKKGAQQRRSRSVRQCSRFRRMKRRIRHSQDMSRKGSSRSKLWTVEFRFSKKLVRILGTSPWRGYWLEIASGMSLLNTSKLDFSNNQHLLSRVFSPICWRARSDLSTHESRQPTSVLLKSVREQ